MEVIRLFIKWISRAQTERSDPPALMSGHPVSPQAGHLEDCPELISAITNANNKKLHFPYRIASPHHHRPMKDVTTFLVNINLMNLTLKDLFSLII